MTATVTTTIYMLSDPNTGRVRYVGKTIKGWRQRLSLHLVQAQRLRHHCANWIRSLGVRPTLTTLEEIVGSLEDGAKAERMWIAHLRSEGCNLTNLTDGGEGMCGYRPTAEVRARIGASQTGKRLSDETKAKISLANRGRRHSLETRQRMSASRIGLKYGPETRAKHAQYRHTPETRAKIAAANRGKVFSEERRAKLRRPKSPEHVAKMAAAKRGFKHSAETRQKMRASHLRRLAEARC